ncbi:MAG TPA: hypothetical protein VFZ72_20020 [Jiangellaceae bacterium]
MAAVMAASAACGDDEPAGGSESSETPATYDEIIDPDTGSDEPAADQAPDDWVTVTDEPTGATFLLPDRTEPLTDTAVTEDGGEVDLRNYAAITDGGIEVGFNIIETPGDSYDVEAGIAGVASALGGEVLDSEDTEVSGQDAVDVEMSYGNDMFVMFTLIPTEDYVMQALASGPESERPVVEATLEQLTESLEVR